MKLLARMNHFVRISAIALVLCVAIVGGALIQKHGTAHACGSYIIPSSTTTYRFISGANNFVTVVFSLWYNSCSQQNFASANIIQGTYSGLQVMVVRNPGPDGGRIAGGNSGTSCPSTGVCSTSGVYSPDNTSYATILTNDGTIINTASF